jgi:excisionase family DNA binding protein
MKIAYTVAEAAEMVGYSERTLKQAISDHDLPARYANSKAIIRHEDLAGWVDGLSAEPKRK